MFVNYQLLKQEKCISLKSINEELLKLEEKKEENSQLLRLLEEEIRKQQINASVKPSINAYLLSSKYFNYNIRGGGGGNLPW